MCIFRTAHVFWSIRFTKCRFRGRALAQDGLPAREAKESRRCHGPRHIPIGQEDSPVCSLATRFHFLVLLQNHISLEIDFLQLSLESIDSVGMGHAACALGCAVGHSMTDIDLLDSKPPWIHEMLATKSSQERECSGCSTRTHVVEVEVRSTQIRYRIDPYLQSKRNAAEAPPAWYYNGPEIWF